MKKACVVLGGGEILDYEVCRSELPHEAFIICADSGFAHCQRLGLEADLLVGDFDSITELPEGVPTIRLPVDKDYTDCALAVEEALSRGYRRIFMAGMTGGRADHTLANLQTLAGLSRRNAEAVITDGVTHFYAFTAPLQGTSYLLEPKERCYFSLFALSTVCKRVNIRGAKYPLIDYDLRFDEARAVSNEFLGREALITMEEGTLLLVVAPMETG